MQQQRGKKKDKDDRWPQNNYLVDVICPQLKSATYGLVLMTCFRHGRGLGYFRVSSTRIAKSACTSKRWVQRILDDFEAYGLIELKEPRRGVIPPTFRIRFSYVDSLLFIDCKIPKRIASGELQTITRKNSAKT